MQFYEIVYLAVYGALIISYMVIKAVHAKKIIRGSVKNALAVMFVGAAVYGCVLKGFNVYSSLVLAATVFAAAGDIFLIFMEKRKLFHCGVFSFGIANLLFIIAGILKYGFVWWPLLIFAALYAVNIICQRTNVYTYGKSFWFLNVYLVFVGLSGCLGIGILSTVTGINALIFGLGTLLFLVSDLFLGLFIYKIRKWPIDAANSLTYFSGLMLIALSILL